MTASAAGHVLICSVNFDASPEGICTGRLVRALLDHGVDVTVVCARRKSRLGFEHPRLRVIALDTGMRHPQWLWRWVAKLRGHIPCHHYPWTRRVARLTPERKPDVVYGRAWPYSSLVAAQALALRLGVPLWLHFSDPFPPPPKQRELPEVMEGLRRMVASAQGATFANLPAIAYQLRHLPEIRPERAHLLNHIAPASQTFGLPEQSQRFVYLGSFNATRPADLLIEGFARHVRQAPEARIHFVGTRPKDVAEARDRCGVADQAVVEPFTQDVVGWQKKASVLLAVDWLVGEPVYLLTKIVESFVVDRPILLLTQPGSPCAELAAHCADTVVCVTSRDPDEVASGFARAAEMARQPGDYARRRKLMEPFTADNVSRQCIQLMLGSVSK